VCPTTTSGTGWALPSRWAGKAFKCSCGGGSGQVHKRCDLSHRAGERKLVGDVLLATFDWPVQERYPHVLGERFDNIDGDAFEVRHRARFAVEECAEILYMTFADSRRPS
jgi:hypothetical protein